jgi:hypothetical protein
MPLLRSDIRASDADRDAVAEFLKGHYAAGRLTQDELDTRVEAAYAAVGLGQLERLVGDLPAPSAPAPARRRGARPAVTGVALAVLAVAALSVVPGELWAALLIMAIPMLIFGGFALMAIAPVAVPALFIVWLVHAVRRAAAPVPLSGAVRQAPMPGSASPRRLG